MQITGTFLKANNIEQISEGFEKRTFQIQTDDKFNPIKCFELMRTTRTNTIESVDGFHEGDKIVVDFNIYQREVKNRWYTSLSAWKVSHVGQGKTEVF